MSEIDPKTNASQGLLAALRKIAETEAALTGIIGLLRRKYPELAPDLDNLESAYDGRKASNRKAPHSRIPRRVRGRWEDRAGDFFLLREGKILAVVHRDGEQWRALLEAARPLGVYPDASAGRKAVERHYKVRPHPPGQE